MLDHVNEAKEFLIGRLSLNPGFVEKMNIFSTVRVPMKF